LLDYFEQHQKDIDAIKALELQKAHLEKNLKLINELKKAFCQAIANKQKKLFVKTCNLLQCFYKMTDYLLPN
jgi:hypothetical protein